MMISKRLPIGMVLLLTGLWAGAGPAAERGAPFMEKYEAGQAQQKAGRFTDARREFEAALALAASGTEKADAQLAIGDVCDAAKDPAAARAAYEKALSVEGVTPAQAGQALVRLSEGYCREYKWQPANAALEKAVALAGVPESIKIQAWMGQGAIWANYGDWGRVKAAYSLALKAPGLTAAQRVTCRKALAKALGNLREYAAYRTVIGELMADGTPSSAPSAEAVPRVVLPEFVAGATLPDAERAGMQVAVAKSFMAERDYPRARAEFLKGQAMPGLTDVLKAEIQLYIGLSYYEAQDYEHAKPELMKVLGMPGADTRPAWDGGRMGYVPAREAKLRLQFRNLVTNDAPLLKVLFIGSSHTLRENIPDLVTKLAASAPAGRPRILAGDYVRMGTPLNTFWDAGDAPDTARGVIMGDPWDAVVFETFYNMNSNVIMKYGSLMVDLVRERKATPVVYESPLPQASPYPERFQKFHDDNVALMKAAKVPIAPSVRAWMGYLGPKPTPEQFAGVYADWIHASPKGAYMTACCIYAALTGQSPVGLYHPAELPEAEARRLQETAWEAYRETNQPL